jgi:hypothetical protein
VDHRRNLLAARQELGRTALQPNASLQHPRMRRSAPQAHRRGAAPVGTAPLTVTPVRLRPYLKNPS